MFPEIWISKGKLLLANENIIIPCNQFRISHNSMFFKKVETLPTSYSLGQLINGDNFIVELSLNETINDSYANVN